MVPIRDIGKGLCTEAWAGEGEPRSWDCRNLLLSPRLEGTSRGSGVSYGSRGDLQLRGASQQGLWSQGGTASAGMQRVVSGRKCPVLSPSPYIHVTLHTFSVASLLLSILFYLPSLASPLVLGSPIRTNPSSGISYLQNNHQSPSLVCISLWLLPYSYLPILSLTHSNLALPPHSTKTGFFKVISDLCVTVSDL